MTKFVTLAAATLVLGAPAFALDLDPNIDADGDGVYSFPELSAVYAEMTDQLFITIDANGDGAIDLAEMEAAQAADLLPFLDS